uniref:CHY zinc finger domain-containing protein n=1 Tax=Trepomonas sp. PC1 TaxID=1076344 RepID=A0A146K8N3_9EUKA|eukprot:JAP91926.1 CHY zinc finger domain-containing protein [Trepomonas sp. PC1]
MASPYFEANTNRYIKQCEESHTPMEIPRPNKKYENELIVLKVVKLKEKNKPKEDPDNWVVLKEFIEDIKNDEIAQEQNEKLMQVKSVMPLDHFKMETFYSSNLYDYLGNFKYMSEIDADLQRYSPDQLIYEARYTIRGVGCQHYVVGCKQQCPICLKYYFCRQCHNEEEDHTLPREKVQNLLCLYCDKQTRFGQYCEHCNEKFCSEFCKNCKFMCFIGKEAKPYFHCEKCNVCRQGDQNQFIHCDKCEKCVFHEDFDKHKCIKRGEGSCPICLGTMTDTVYVVSLMNCGHFVHNHCWQKLLQENNFTCPICKKYSITVDQQAQIAKFYEEQTKKHFCIENGQEILCQECGKNFYFYLSSHYKCVFCDSYNTVVKGGASKQVVDQHLKEYKYQPHYLTVDSLYQALQLIDKQTVLQNETIIKQQIHKQFDHDQGASLQLILAQVGLEQILQLFLK